MINSKSILFDLQTIIRKAKRQIPLGEIWRFLVAIFDWRSILRKILKLPAVDVVYISNMRDETDLYRFLGKSYPKDGHFDGPRHWIRGVAGRTRAINTITRDLMKIDGCKRARKQIISAIRWAQANGTKVVLLAASTKRLFGKDDTELKEMFPNIIFTIGDNGTMFLLREETFKALKEAGLKSGSSRIAVLGPYGLLGKMMVEFLKRKGYDIIGTGTNESALKKIADEYQISYCHTFSEMGKVDAVIACTHNEKICLCAEHIDLIRHLNKKLLVIDVAEPSNLRYEEYRKCKDVVIRQDAGNAYAPRLKYVLGAITYRMFGLTRGVVFGCFAESLVIASALQRGENVEKIDWFNVNEKNMEIVEELFNKDGFTLPSPRCFGKLVKSFNLNL